MSAPAILSLGSINADFQMRVDAPLEEGRTLIARDFVRLGGGKAANVAFLARRLGHPALLIGRVGDDELAEQALGSLREIEVDLTHVSRAPGASTAVSTITVPPNGKKSIVLAPNANDEWDAEHISRAVRAIEGAAEGSVLVVDYEVPADLVGRAIKAAGGRGLRVVLDPSPADRVAKNALPGLSAITANPKEAGTVTGIEVDGPEAAAKAAVRLHEMGVEMACVKLADGGCLVAHEGEITRISAPDVKAVDSTGAGDAFAGALAVALLEKQSAADAVRFAVAASSLAVTAYGSQPAYPSRDEIDALLPSIVTRLDAREPTA